MDAISISTESLSFPEELIETDWAHGSDEGIDVKLLNNLFDLKKHVRGLWVNLDKMNTIVAEYKRGLRECPARLNLLKRINEDPVDIKLSLLTEFRKAFSLVLNYEDRNFDGAYKCLEEINATDEELRRFISRPDQGKDIVLSKIDPILRSIINDYL